MHCVAGIAAEPKASVSQCAEEESPGAVVWAFGRISWCVGPAAEGYLDISDGMIISSCACCSCLI